MKCSKTLLAFLTLSLSGLATAACSTSASPGDSGVDSGPGAAEASVDVIVLDAADERTMTTDVIPSVDARVDDIVIDGAGLAMFEGRTVHLALEERVMGTIVARAMSRVVGGAFTVTLPAAFDRDSFGMVLHVYVDLDADDRCTVADRTWSQNILNDFMHGAVHVMVGVPDAGVTIGTCDAFP